MKSPRKSEVCQRIAAHTPSFVQVTGKRILYNVIRTYNKHRHIEKGRLVEIGGRFRYDRVAPYRTYIGERTIIREYNIWNAQLGDIVVGKRCWFGLYDIVMGPVEIGDDTHTGPFVSILGPHHPVLDVDDRKQKTIIGNNVRMLTGAIILYGVKIGNNAVISAGSVVTKDVPAGAFVGGNPARDLSKLADVLWKGAPGQPRSSEQVT